LICLLLGVGRGSRDWPFILLPKEDKLFLFGSWD
jgi:hypothetical protein